MGQGGISLVISKRLKVAHSGRGSQHPTCRGSSSCGQGERAAQAALGAGWRVSATILCLHGSRAGLDVAKQEWGGGYFSNGDERWSCRSDRQSCVLGMSKELLRFGLSLEVGDPGGGDCSHRPSKDGDWISVQKSGALFHHLFQHPRLVVGSHG